MHVCAQDLSKCYSTDLNKIVWKLDITLLVTSKEKVMKFCNLPGSGLVSSAFLKIMEWAPLGTATDLSAHVNRIIQEAALLLNFWEGQRLGQQTIVTFWE